MFDWVSHILQRAAAYVAAFFSGRFYEKRVQAEKERDQALQEVQKRSDSSIATVDDAVMQLRARAMRKRKKRS